MTQQIQELHLTLYASVSMLDVFMAGQLEKD